MKHNLREAKIIKICICLVLTAMALFYSCTTHDAGSIQAGHTEVGQDGTKWEKSFQWTYQIQ